VTDSPRTAVFLIGYRGSGKTSVGKALAAMTAGEFVDTDPLIEQKAGKTIAEIFADDGEGSFRDLESLVVHEVVRRAKKAARPFVVATGGGAILREQNTELMREGGRVIWLRAKISELRERIAADPKSGDARPALAGATAVDEVEQVLTERIPIYLAAAHHVIDTDGLSVEGIAELVRDVLS